MSLLRVRTMPIIPHSIELETDLMGLLPLDTPETKAWNQPIQILAPRLISHLESNIAKLFPPMPVFRLMLTCEQRTSFLKTPSILKTVQRPVLPPE